MSDARSNLSPDGLARRDKILALAQSAARGRRRNRLAAQVGIGAACLAIVSVFVLRPDTPVQVARIVPAVVAPAPATATESMWIETDATIVDRLSLPRERPQWQRIGDDEFLKELADAGQPAGLVQIGGKTLLLPR